MISDLLMPLLTIALIMGLNALMCLGVYVATQFEGSDTFDSDPAMMRAAPVNGKMILWWIRWYGSMLPAWFHKPLYKCLPCMASIWSLPVFIVLSLVNDPSVWLLWPFYVLSLSGLNFIIAVKFT